MRRFFVGLVLCFLFACAPAPHAGGSLQSAPVTSRGTPRSSSMLILATTTSTQDSGLLDVLLPRFQEETGLQVKIVAVGTGQALKMGMEGNADVLLVHAPAAEEDFMEQGYGKDRVLVMHNDFLLLGPGLDPARVMETTDIVEAFRAIARAGAVFLSRGDGSGTHTKELQLWKQAGVDPSNQPWYLESGQGMGPTLMIADQKMAYTLSDRGTFLANRDHLSLKVVFQGDPSLRNVYHGITVNPEKYPGVNYEGARAFLDFLASPSIQAMIGAFGKEKFGEPLFTPDAGKDESGFDRP